MSDSDLQTRELEDNPASYPRARPVGGTAASGAIVMLVVIAFGASIAAVFSR